MRDKFGDLRWVPLEPEFIEYPNAQFLMIGEAQDTLGKAATAEGAKLPHEEEPGQELEQMERENEQRVEALQGKSKPKPIDGLWFVSRSNVKCHFQAIRPSIKILAWMPRSILPCRQRGTPNSF